jgi:2-hydroxyacyl-CoA lyase 1
MFNMKPNALIYSARYDRMMEAFGGKGFFVEDPKDLKGALDEAMNFRGPALVRVVISQGSARNLQQFRWHSLRAEVLWGAPSGRGLARRNAR